MKSSEDRRSPHVRRVTLATLVDICLQEGDPAPFQAESANVSGRGMHVRTSYLPEVGEELVCRLNHDDHEILVEGRVAWRSEGHDSGEFGIQFTALDADSAHVLQSLGEPVIVSRSPSPLLPEAEEEALGADVFSEGSRVKLHIEGLGAPMKACVHEGTTRKVRVGSSLEFLKMGRDLEIEHVGDGVRRGASVDSINVVINPTTSIPELVVQLRYEGVSPTPPPAEARRIRPNYDDAAFDAAPEKLEDEDSNDFGEDDAAPWEPAAEALRVRLGGAMKTAGSAAHKATNMLGSVAQSARASVMAVAARRAESAGSRTRSQSPGAKRRQTTTRARMAPTHLRSGIHDLGLAKKRPPEVSRKGKAVQPTTSRRRLGAPVFFALACVVFGGSAFVLRAMGSSENVATEAVAVQESAPSTPTSSKTNTGAKQAKKAEPAEDGVVADVPLFGPQAMAIKPAEEPSADVDEATLEKRSAAAAVADQTWEEPEPEPQEAANAPWGRGRLYLPTIHRIRLDGAGGALAGAVNADGFTVVVPGRKAMESGKAIEKRDKRIAAVKTSNGAQGATLKFEFRGAVPPYRVRLRQDFVEFLISAPEETVARL